jgi:peptide/nickel transport system substrate-binding protein
MKPLLLLAATAALLAGGELRLVLHDEPKTLDPWMVADESSEALRFLTEGVLIRINRATQQPEAELASSWKVTKNGAMITFQLRRGVKFPDGSPFTSRDVVRTFERFLDPALHSPIADTLKTDKGTVKVRAEGDYTVVAEFPAPAATIERLFDQVSIVSAAALSRNDTQRPVPGLGPFVVAERKAGVSIVLKKNSAYWKRDRDGKPLPRVDSIRFDIEQNRDLELLRFRRGEVDLIERLTPDLYERLAADSPASAVDAGASTDMEFLWFNQAQRAPLAAPTKEWFRSAAFRRSVSQAINRTDLCRVVYRGHASPAAGPVSPSNKLWRNEKLAVEPTDPAAALKRLEGDGFRLQSGVLRDHAGNAVEFSIITNAGSKTRERMAVMIQ